MQHELISEEPKGIVNLKIVHGDIPYGECLYGAWVSEVEDPGVLHLLGLVMTEYSIN